MFIIFQILAVGYGTLMMILGVLAYKTNAITFMTMLINILSGIFLVISATCRWRYQLLCIIFALVCLLIAAMVNGIEMNGKINYLHVAVRCFFSICIIYFFVFEI